MAFRPCIAELGYLVLIPPSFFRINVLIPDEEPMSTMPKSRDVGSTDKFSFAKVQITW